MDEYVLFGELNIGDKFGYVLYSSCKEEIFTKTESNFASLNGTIFGVKFSYSFNYNDLVRKIK